MARSLLLGPIPEPLLTEQEKLVPLLVLKSNMFQVGASVGETCYHALCDNFVDRTCGRYL